MKQKSKSIVFVVAFVWDYIRSYLPTILKKTVLMSKYDEIPAELEETAKNAARDCAVTAIYLKK